MSTLRELLERGTAELQGVSPSARLDAELLLSHAVGLSRLKLISQSEQVVPYDQEQTFRDLLIRRKAFEPVAYIIEMKEFWGLEFVVTREVLIPRPETELVVELALELLADIKEKVKILDLGTGTGCIAIAVATELVRQDRSVQVIATDSSRAALAMAARNISKHDLGRSINTVESDWFECLAPDSDQFDLILSNPPYVSSDSPAVSPETDYEPPAALYASDHGLAAIKLILEQGPDFLKRGGALICEIGDEQRESVTAHFERLIQAKMLKGTSLEFRQDLAGKDRALLCREG